MKTKLPEVTKYFLKIPVMYDNLMRDLKYKKQNNKKKEVVDIFDQVIL
jgi:hypothetical protein